MRYLLLSLVALGTTACGGVTDAIGEYGQAKQESEAFLAGQAARGEDGWTRGMAIHAKYMATSVPADAKANTWYADRTLPLKQMDQLFAAVQTAGDADRGLLSRVRLGEAWDKLVGELETLLGPDAHPEMRELTAQVAADKAVFYYGAVDISYVSSDAELATKHAAAVQKARARKAALEAKYGR